MPVWTIPPRLDELQVFGGTSERARRSLNELAASNRFCGGARSVIASFAMLGVRLPAGKIRVLDVGSGGGEIARGLAQWGRKTGRPLEVIALDRHGASVARAVAQTRDLREINHLRADAFDLPFRAGSFDVVLSSMLLHYFALDDAARLLANFARLARHAVLIADIERHWFPCLAISALAPLTGNRVVRRHFRDTVLHGFTTVELAEMARAAGFVRWKISRSLSFRLMLVAELDQRS